MLKLGRGIDRKAVRRALGGRRRPVTFGYTGVLRASDIREALAGIRDAGSPRWAQPLLAWFASHPNAPLDVLRELFALGGREVLLSLALNPRLPADMKRTLMQHEDAEVRDHAYHVLTRRGR